MAELSHALREKILALPAELRGLALRAALQTGMDPVDAIREGFEAGVRKARATRSQAPEVGLENAIEEAHS